MCVASKYLSEVDAIVKRINEDYKLLNQQQSKYDTMLADHYHKIECGKFNACEGYYLTKQLQEILRKRRIVKDEMSRLFTLKQSLNVGKMENSINACKHQISKAKKKSNEWQQDWNYTYTLEEAIN